MTTLVPAFRPILELEIAVDPPLSVGASAAGEVRVIPFRGGTFAGAELSGRVLAGGADWQEIRSDGVRSGPPDVLARLGRGELLPASAYYFRTAIRLRTASPRLARLNDVLAFSIGERFAEGVRLALYELL